MVKWKTIKANLNDYWNPTLVAEYKVEFKKCVWLTMFVIDVN